MTIANSGHDENGKYHGGKAGDQTGGEWTIQNWYNRPWDAVARYPKTEVANDIAYIATQGAKNNKIGYDQYQRETFWNKLKSVKDYDPKNITEACEADCSAGVAACVKAVGYRKKIKALKDVPVSMWTGIEINTLKKAGFDILTDSKYLTSDGYLLPGDILINSAHHTAINLSTGSKVAAKTTSKPTDTKTAATKAKTTETKPVTVKSKTYSVTAKSGLNCRKGAGINNPIVVDKSVPYRYGDKIDISETKDVNGVKWGKTSKGWVCMTYVKLI